MKTLTVILIIGIVVSAISNFVQAAPASLQEQITYLQAQIARLREQIEALRPTPRFIKTLKYGSWGIEVKELQKFLKHEPEIYPQALITGYFGPLTRAAVKRFQAKHGISPIGIVGPKTRAKINELIFLETRIVPEHPEQKPAEYAILPKPDYDLENLAKEIQRLVNRKRKAAGLLMLAWDEQISQLASAHSQEQAQDNQKLTAPEFLCHYPLIRHEGFSFGFTPQQRMDNRNISYQIVGENIVIIPLAKNLVYKYRADAPPVKCPEALSFESGKGSQEQIIKQYQKVLSESLKIVEALEPILWVNKEWLSPGQAVEKAVISWMNSSGHRETMLKPEFNFGGVGIAKVNDYIIITHNFVKRIENEAKKR